MPRLWRLGLAAALGVGTFVAAVDHFDEAAREGCVQRADGDDRYEVRVGGGAGTDVTRYRLAVSRDGRPVVGASVCVAASMDGMAAMAVTGEGREVAPGSYEVPLHLGMEGRWTARVVVTERGGREVAVPVILSVG
ncbi:MAG TPA: FixH family protein [Acidimicrobiales bacterium]|nr:FixH family protein [Acidimicrobiales bacterium]